MSRIHRIRTIAPPSTPTVELRMLLGADGQVVYDTGSAATNFTMGTSSSVEASDPVYTQQGVYFDNKIVRGSRTPFQASENRTFLILFAAAARATGQLFTIGGPPFGIRLNSNGTLRFTYYKTGTTTSTNVDMATTDGLYDPNTFHIASVRKSTTSGIRIGIDKGFKTDADTTALNNVTTGNTQLGRNSDNGFPFTGAIAHFCFWNTALSDADFNAAYDYILAYNARLRGIGVPGLATILTS